MHVRVGYVAVCQGAFHDSKLSFAMWTAFQPKLGGLSTGLRAERVKSASVKGAREERASFHCFSVATTHSKLKI